MEDYESNTRRPQHQQPRFNRREFLAQQQAKQGGDPTSVPLTTSREDRAAYQSNQQRPQREDRPARPPRDPDMTLAEFKEKLAEVKWLFTTPNEEQSFFGVVESMEQQIKLYNMARRLSPAHLKAFVYAQQNALKKVTPDNVEPTTLQEEVVGREESSSFRA